MRKIQLILIICLFCIGGIVSSQVSAQDGRACVRRCNEHFKQARQRCSNLSGRERAACIRAANERHRRCLASCR